VVEKIGDIGFEGVGVEDPSAVRDGDAELMFFVALAVERQKLAAYWAVTQGFQRTGNGFDGRRLIVVSVEGAEGPTNLGTVTVAPKRGLMADSEMGGSMELGGEKLPSENRVGRMPAESVSQEKGLNLSSM
jgi:hypothetical protein